MRSQWILISLIFLTSACQNEKVVIEAKIHDYMELELVKNDSTFWIEKGGDHYKDNYVYNNCNVITFEYRYEKNGDHKYFEMNGVRDWNFVTKDTLMSGKGIQKIRLSSLNPNPDYSYSPQSTIRYEYLDAYGKVLLSSHTGIVENYKNILIHNMRGGFFWKLFPFPWPSIKFPIVNGEKWNWQWNYDGDSFGDDRFTKWEGIIRMEYEYEIIGRETIELAFGNVECYKILAIGRYEGIKNQLEYYFNPKIGFVKFIFKTNDGAIINLYATDYKDTCKEQNK